MCHLCGWLKLFLKNVWWEKNKKHRVGNECRLTCCTFVISFLCPWSLVKMVYFFIVFSRLFVVVGSSFTLAANVGACAVAGLGGLVKGDSPTSPTSCKLSTVTNVYNETECLMQLRTRPLHKHAVSGRYLNLISIQLGIGK